MNRYREKEHTMRVLLTGGAGRLGIHVCKALLQDGLQVRLFDLNTPRNQRRVKSVLGKAEILWGDITQPASVREAIEGVDMVVHMAAILPPVDHERPELAARVNVGGTRILVDRIKEMGGHTPIIHISSAAVFGPAPDATEPLSPDRNEPHPDGVYGKTKLQAENLIKESGIDYAILRLTATMYLIFEASDLKRMFSIPLNNRIEYCHPEDTSMAILNAIKNFDDVKGNTLIISGGPGQRMLYRDMIQRILGVLGLPLPPIHKFTSKPYYLDWYDTSKSQRLLRFQRKTFSDFLEDYARELAKWYTPLFLPLMRYFVGPVFGKLITRMI